MKIGIRKDGPPFLSTSHAVGASSSMAWRLYFLALIRTKKATERKYTIAGRKLTATMVRYEIWVNVAITKAPAPMIGGMIMPPVDAG